MEGVKVAVIVIIIVIAVLIFLRYGLNIDFISELKGFVEQVFNNAQNEIS